MKKVVNDARRSQSLLGEKIKTTLPSRERQEAVNEATEIKKFLAIQESHITGLQTKLLELGLRIPNVTHKDVPIGPDTTAVTLSTHGPECMEPNRARDHWKICQELDLVNFDDAAVATGSFWYYLQGAAALLEQALVNYALSVAIKHGYAPVMTPDVVKADVANRCGFVPRERDESRGTFFHHLYHIEGSAPDLVLAGTAEIPLAGMFVKKTFLENQLPRRLVAVGHAFRSEAGARGADTRGLYRVHQFTKVELFAVTEEDQSDAMMEELRQIQIEIFEGLGFPFRYASNILHTRFHFLNSSHQRLRYADRGARSLRVS